MFSELPGFATSSGLVARNPLVRSVPAPHATLSADKQTLTAIGTTGAQDNTQAFSQTAFTTGKRYFELKVINMPGPINFGMFVGIAEVATVTQVDLSAAYIHDKIWVNLYGYNDYYNDNTKAIAGPGANWSTTGDIIGVVFDMASGAQTLDFYKNGVHAFAGNGTFSNGAYYAAFCGFVAQQPMSFRMNFGDEPFIYMPVITGLVEWNNGL